MVNQNYFSIFVSFLLLLLLCSSIETPYKRIVHNLDPEAKCLDGSPGAMYINQGIEKDKFFIFFIGGGICQGLTPQQSISQCYKRSKTFEGSSKFWPEEFYYSTGYLSSDPDKNKFANWTQIVFGYCDGFIHQGYRKQPVVVNNTKIYFRGSAITRSHFKYLSKEYSFLTAKQVVLTGPSAGGFAALQWSNYVQRLLRNPTVVSVVADSGSLLQYPAFGLGINLGSIIVENIFSVANVDEKLPNARCNFFYKGQEWRCFSIENSYWTISPKILLIESQYDEFQIRNILRVGCVKNGTVGGVTTQCSENQIAYIEEYRQYFNSFIQKFLFYRKNSAWTISCIKHTAAYLDEYYDSQNYKVPQKTGKTVKQAIDQFVFQNKKVRQIDEVKYPNNAACAV